jgi:hypothetical protein
MNLSLSVDQLTAMSILLVFKMKLQCTILEECFSKSGLFLPKLAELFGATGRKP